MAPFAHRKFYCAVTEKLTIAANCTPSCNHYRRLSGYRRFVAIIAGIAARSPLLIAFGIALHGRNITSGGVAAPAFGNADDRVAVPNRDPVESNLLRQDLRLWLFARR